MVLIPIRLFFTKSGRAVYISHLDLNRAMSRALARSGLPVWYTEGFHPHLYTTFALPLSLGVTGLSETMDFRLTQEIPFEEAARAVGAALPEGLHALSAAAPVMEPKEIAWATYRADLICDGERGAKAVNALATETIVMADKRSKKGIQKVDIRPLFEVVDCVPNESGVSLTLRCRAGVETNLNPALVVEALTFRQLSVFQCKLTRVAVQTQDGRDFC